MAETIHAAAIVVAAGNGERAGGIDKVLQPLGGRKVIERAVAPFLSDPRITQVVIVAPAGREAEYLEAAFPNGAPASPRVTAISGGERRQDSVAAGLAALRDEITIVAVHDAARPLHSPEVLTLLLDTAIAKGAAVPCVPIPDTVVPVDATTASVSGVLDRRLLRLVQTPQVFRRDWLVAAHAKARDESIEATDDATLVLALRHPVSFVPGLADNIKITTAMDFRVAEALLES